MFKCHLLKTHLNTSLFYLVSLMILLYECYKSLTVPKLLELYTRDKYSLFFLICILLHYLQLNSLYAFQVTNNRYVFISMFSSICLFPTE